MSDPHFSSTLAETFAKIENLTLESSPPPLAKCLLPHQTTYHSLHARGKRLEEQARQLREFRKSLIMSNLEMKFKRPFFNKIAEMCERLIERQRVAEEVSHLLLGDVVQFLSTQSRHATPECVFGVIEEVRALQSCAQELLLTPTAFTVVREQLSEEWKRLKVMEKEARRRIAERKARYEREAKSVEARVAEARTRTELEEIAQAMPTLALGRVDRARLEGEIEQRKSTLPAEEGAAELRAQLEEYRRLLGGSMLDMAQSLHYHSLIEQLKERLAALESIS